MGIDRVARTIVVGDRRTGSIDDWVRVFKRKRDEIVQARCAA
jgi:hypothetical protein